MGAVPILTRQIFPLINQTVRAIAPTTQANWMESVYRAKLWSGEKDAYAKSITWDMTGDFSAVVQSDYKNADEIETGRPPYDLKQMLNTSPKVRRTKDGRRFLIIPFRQNTPGQDALAQGMPPDVYTAGSALKASTIVGQAKRASGEMTSIHPTWGTRPLKKQTPFMSGIKSRAPVMVQKKSVQVGGSPQHRRHGRTQRSREEEVQRHGAYGCENARRRPLFGLSHVPRHDGGFHRLDHPSETRPVPGEEGCR